MSTKAFLPRIAALVALAVLTVLLTGCGSGSKSDSNTRSVRVPIHIDWPAKPALTSNSRYIPSYASSIFFELVLKSSPTTRYNLIVNRPSEKPSSQDVTFSQLLSAGDYVLAASARVGADGQGATVASASVNVAVKPGMSPVDMTLASTIKTIQILGQPLAATVGTPVNLQSGAFDPDGRTLLLPSDALTWSIVTGSQFGTLTPAGVLTPTAAGTIHVKLSEAGAGVSAEANVTVTTQTIIASLGATPYPKEGADLLNTGLVTGHGAAGHVAWTYDLGASSGFYLTTPILGGNGIVYASSIATANTGAVGVHTSDGTKAFQVPLNGSTPWSPVVLSTNLTCFPLDNIGLVALDANTGIERWRNSTVNAISPATVDRSGHILLGARDGVHVLDAGNGNDTAVYPGTNCGMPAVATNGTVYYVRQTGSSSANGELVAMNPTTKQAIWTAGEIEQGHVPVIGPNGNVYVVGSQSGTAFTRLVCFNAATGAVEAELRSQFFSFSQDPVFGADGLLYIGQGNKVTAYSLSLAQVRQSAAITGNGDFFSVRRITIGSDGTLYTVADQNSPDSPAQLLAFNTTDLSQKWKIDVTGRVLGSLAVDSDGTIYFLTDGGKLTAVR